MTEWLEPGANAPAKVRSPLLAQTNILSSTATVKVSQRVRRKSSFVRRRDSSESVPSSHDSIFVAEYLSPVNSEDNDYKTEPRQNFDSSVQLPAMAELPSLLPDNDENSSGPLSIGSTPILYGHGTPLATIIEQKSSSATMRTSTSTMSPTRTLIRARSASDLSLSTASASTSTQPQITGASPLKAEFSISGMIRRLASFSADDLDSVKLSWPEGYDPNRATGAGKSSMDSEIPKMQDSTMDEINEIYAQPLRPLQPPIERPSTPPGMPSWTAAQQRRPRVPPRNPTRGWGIHGASSLVHRFFGHQPSDPSASVVSSRRASGSGPGYGVRGPWDAIPAQRRSVSTPILTGRGAPRFRPPRSGHGISELEMHPFARAEIMPVKTENPAAMTMGRRSVSSAVAGTSRCENETLRQRNVRPTGKRKSGQRVRFSPSTTDGTGTTHMQPHELTPETSASATNLCPHRRVSSANPDLLEIVTPPPVSDDSLTPQSILSDPLENSTDHLTNASSGPEASFRAPSDVATARSKDSKVPSSECWKCRVESVLAKADTLWERSASWCCWYCCGIDMEELVDDSAYSDTGVRVRDLRQAENE